MIVVILAVALTLRGTAGTPTTGADPSAHGDADVVMPAHEVRSRGPPTSSVRLARPTAAVPVSPFDPQCTSSHRSAARRARARDAGPDDNNRLQQSINLNIRGGLCRTDHREFC